MRRSVVVLMLLLSFTGVADAHRRFSMPFNAVSMVPAPVDAPDENGLYYDDTRWVRVALPPGILVCQPDSTGQHFKCIPVPPGAILMLPVPQED